MRDDTFVVVLGRCGAGVLHGGGFERAVCEQIAKKSTWVVKTNPYEGRSDHTVFGPAGVPSLLNWHFTDRYYHSSVDTPDKTSPQEMRNVGLGPRVR